MAEARKKSYKASQAGVDWQHLVATPLFRSKRASHLADLLEIRQVFNCVNLSGSTAFNISDHLKQPGFKRACIRLFRYCKAKQVGVAMMDISVAGAVYPYNLIAGGKLVSMLMASPQIREAYRTRYSNASSIIASGLKGGSVIREPSLVLLCTTSIFGRGSVQYNRIRVPAEQMGGTGQVVFKKLTSETSYATFQFSDKTMEELKKFAHQYNEGLNVNSIFGEGVNPRMRKLREELERIGLPADELLQAESPRAVYGIALAHNFRDVLLGRSDQPDWIIPLQGDGKGASATISRHWGKRWALPRASRSEILERMSSDGKPIISQSEQFLASCDQLSLGLSKDESMDYFEELLLPVEAR
jgi:hypothetical protein